MQTQWSLPNTSYMTCYFCSAVPDYAKMQGNTTHSVSTNPITGLSDVTFTYTVTSHWSSLAVVKSVYGQLTKELTNGDTVVDALERLFTHSISLLVSAVCSSMTCGVLCWYVCICMSTPCLMCQISCPCLCCGYSHGLVITVKSIERYEISMPCGSVVNLHSITSAAKHDCAQFPVQQS